MGEGSLSEQRLELAAWLGHKAARAALPEGPPPARRFDFLLRRLRQAGKPALVRAALAGVRSAGGSPHAHSAAGLALSWLAAPSEELAQRAAALAAELERPWQEAWSCPRPGAPAGVVPYSSRSSWSPASVELWSLGAALYAARVVAGEVRGSPNTRSEAPVFSSTQNADRSLTYARFALCGPGHDQHICKLTPNHGASVVVASPEWRAAEQSAQAKLFAALGAELVPWLLGDWALSPHQSRDRT